MSDNTDRPQSNLYCRHEYMHMVDMKKTKQYNLSFIPFPIYFLAYSGIPRLKSLRSNIEYTQHFHHTIINGSNTFQSSRLNHFKKNQPELRV